jgi:hypothetical protein
MGGYSLGNDSVAVAVRSIRRGMPMFIDELGDSEEYGERRRMLEDALRRGYRDSPTAVYSRCEGRDNKVVHYPVFGPKAFTHRVAIESALNSRAFIIEMRKAPGWRPVPIVPKEIERALRAWGRRVLREWPASRVAATQTAPEFRDRLQAILASRYGGNRITELSGIALLLSDMAHVDLSASLRAAAEASASQEDAEVELSAILRDSLTAALSMPEICTIENGWATILHRDVLSMFNMTLRGIGLPPVDTTRLALIRREAGVLGEWVRQAHGGRSVWVFPVSWLKFDGRSDAGT